MRVWRERQKKQAEREKKNTFEMLFMRMTGQLGFLRTETIRRYRLGGEFLFIFCVILITCISRQDFLSLDLSRIIGSKVKLGLKIKIFF